MNSPSLKSIGRNLKEARINRGYSMRNVQERLGRKGYSKSMLSMIENGKNQISLLNFFRLVKLYGVDLKTILETPKVCPRCKGTGKYK